MRLELYTNVMRTQLVLTLRLERTNASVIKVMTALESRVNPGTIACSTTVVVILMLYV